MDKKEYKENNDTLITFGEEALTMRKDDPRTKKYKKKVEKKMEENRKIYEDASTNPFKGVNLKNARSEDENYEEYRTRLKLNNILQKQYKKVGREQFLEMYPAGVKYAIDQAKEEIMNNSKPQLTATATIINEDGTTGENIPVIVNNDKNK
tara:strand:+ start:61 stop:513 length:453 start_codon:yes stop_codon:yes gene_type:complete